MSPRHQRDIAEESDHAFCLDGQYRISGAVNANIYGRVLGAVRPPGHAINRELIKLAAIVLGNCWSRSIEVSTAEEMTPRIAPVKLSDPRHFLPFETFPSSKAPSGPFYYITYI